LNSKCWLQISSGNGPEECCCAAGKVYREIKAEAVKKGISVSLIHAVPSQVNGNFKSLLLSLVGGSFITS
jgi:peptide chain release factor